MATTSIFDCGDTLQLPRRQLVSYDDDDLFTFESDASSNQDEVDNAAKNLRFKVTVENSNHKRKRSIISDDDDGEEEADYNRHWYHESKKKRISNVASCSNSTSNNNTTIRRGAQSHEKRTQPKKGEREPYELIREIGQGTYGRVYKGRCTETQAVIAIKRLKCKVNTPNSDLNLDFIKREYDNLMEMQYCENIVHLYTGRERLESKNDLTIDLLFEYCPYDLKKLISNRQINFRLNEIKTFLRQMLLGLRELHSKSIMHRDFKTENILLTADGVVKIADFGLSRKMIDTSTTFERVHYTLEVVTQWYRAPEILLGETQYNERIDMWSVGCIMGEFWQRAAILQGENEIGQINLISKLCGSMKPENWPNIVNLRVYKSIVELPKSIRQTRYFLKNKLPYVSDDQANNFFDKLMICNPDKRLSAEQALNDEFFYTDPLPARDLKNFMSRIIPILRV